MYNEYKNVHSQPSVVAFCCCWCCCLMNSTLGLQPNESIYCSFGHNLLLPRGKNLVINGIADCEIFTQQFSYLLISITCFAIDQNISNSTKSGNKMINEYAHFFSKLLFSLSTKNRLFTNYSHFLRSENNNIFCTLHFKKNNRDGMQSSKVI